MNRDVLYVAILTVLCVLLGVLVGAGITKKANLPWPYPERLNFAERAEHFMGMGPKGPCERGPGERRGEGLFKMLAGRLDLNQEQQGKVKEILDNTRQEIDKVGESVRGAINGIKEKSDKEIMDILNPQQQEKFKTLLKELDLKHGPEGPKGERRPGGPGDKGGPIGGEPDNQGQDERMPPLQQ